MRRTIQDMPVSELRQRLAYHEAQRGKQGGRGDAPGARLHAHRARAYRAELEARCHPVGEA